MIHQTLEHKVLMIRHRVAFALLLFILPVPILAQVARYVNPFLGTEGDGNTFPGASVPFGMIKPGPDIGSNDANSGWEPDGNINGFSQTHVSGTGGGAKYGNILIQPTVGDILPEDHGSLRTREQASAGFYRVALTRYSVDAEVTTASRSALYRFTYPTSKHANIIFDVSHCLSSKAKAGEAQYVTESSVNVLSNREISGSSTVTGGWNKQPNTYTVFFYVLTDTPASGMGTWLNKDLHDGLRQQHGARGEKTGAWLTFSTGVNRQVRLKLGISFVSADQAKRNALAQIPTFNFDAMHRIAIAAWERAVGGITIRGATEEQKQTFYTALYHTMLMPVDRTGDNPLWTSQEPYYDDYYAIWDIFRSSGPLLTLIQPERQADIVRSLVNIYQHEGWLPDARSGDYNGRTQGGSDAEFLIADAFVKGLKKIDWGSAYQAMLKDAEVSPVDQIKEGRGGLEDWRQLGYVTIEGVDRPGSKQMEYAANDFAIATVAKGIGRNEDYLKYRKRASNWENLWDANFEDGGFKGFIRPRHRDGSWKQDFSALQGCSWGGDTFYEGNSWTYSTFVPQDVAELISKTGGKDIFVDRLDAFFATKGRYDVGNEPGFLAPYLYIWAGRHDKTAEHVRDILARSFHAGRSGLPGNDDSGAMSSWYAFSVMGFFPNAGQDIYLIGSPAFMELRLRLANHKAFTIAAKNASPENKYIVAAEWNGKPYDRAWFRHDDLMRGGKLVLTMASHPGIWPTGASPPSLSDEK